MNPNIYLIGVGMGNPDTLTVEAQQAIDACPVLIGAPRLLEGFGEDKILVPLTSPQEIADYLAKCEAELAGILLSGDLGFFSGAKALWPLLAGWEVEAIPGLSSLSYFCARLRTAWQDVFVVSAHGRAHNAAGEIQCHEKTFVLTGGETRAEDICQSLRDRGLGHLTVWVGEKLSYPDEQITAGTAAELAEAAFDSLAVLLAANPEPVGQAAWAAGMPDDAFLRGEVPMTKSEVRALVLSKLRPAREHIIWDVGAGTGSVSVELALAAPAGWVFAVEKRQEALELLKKNKERFHLPHMKLVAGEAPDVLAPLPAPDRVFLGGTSGAAEDILALALEKNPNLRVVAAAVTLETLAETARVFGALGLADVDIVQVGITRTREAGGYHLMDAQNPVWLISGEGRP